MSFLDRIFAAREQKKSGFVLALGGGGGRGLAHLGVLEVLEEHHLKPDVIVGSSIGALFGGMYAVTPDARLVIRRAEEILASDLFGSIELPVLGEEEDESWLSRLTSAAKQTILYTRAATDTSFADTNALVDIAFGFCGGEFFSDAKIPLFVTAVQFPGGECEIFSIDSGVKMPCAIAASMAIPGVFDPVSIAGRKYVDGGVASELPSKEARMVARPDQLVVAVNVGSRPRPDVEPANVYGMLDWTNEIKSLYLRRYSKEYADIVIEPLVSFTQWHDFSNPEQEIDRGRQAAYEQMPKLIAMLGRDK
ncbi:NTE family protein [Mariprofundus ferrinatatus]|uniref:NTE family protein n=1 Tax=Mariprofundus ferrinatatus TaxID=1921087 RepID=A0A2K8L8K6_9PROT|nr:patatin-like phospholipase family protein [Mariprofundus ferrinatatus]ATX81264.1 NTE family protein [Mariprofundus ferrinatatus]